MKNHLLHAGLCGVMALVPFTVVPSAQATYPGSQAGRLVFGLDLPDVATPDIYSVLPNGKALHQLTEGPASDICPSWSPDGKSIAFCSDRSGTFQIWVMKHNGTHLRQVTSDRLLPALFPDYSPDGGRIAYMAGTGPEVDIWVVDLASGNPTRLTTTPGLDGFPAWSPDGSRIAFISTRPGVDDKGLPQSGVAQVWVMDADGTDPVQLTFDPAPKGQLPDWSPDGTKIAFQKVVAGSGDIFVMDADGTDVRQLTRTPQEEFGPAWSPDGTQVAFVRVLSGPLNRSIVVVDADGTDERVVTTGTRVPTWQPRGDRR